MTRPAVDIIIPFHGKYEYVTRCCESVLRCTPNQPFQITLIDDGSPNPDFLRSLISNKIGGWQSEEQLGFGGAVNEGVANTSSPWVVVMHSDVQVKDIYWLLHMQRTMERLKATGVKLVSARANDMGTAASYDERIIAKNPEDLTADDFVVDQPVPLFCCLLHRDLFNRVGPLKAYPYAWYEDEELFWRMKKAGYKQAICGMTAVHHEGGATIKDLWKSNPQSRAVMESNYDACMSDVNGYARMQNA